MSQVAPVGIQEHPRLELGRCAVVADRQAGRLATPAPDGVVRCKMQVASCKLLVADAPNNASVQLLRLCSSALLFCSNQLLSYARCAHPLPEPLPLAPAFGSTVSEWMAQCSSPELPRSETHGKSLWPTTAAFDLLCNFLAVGHLAVVATFFYIANVPLLAMVPLVLISPYSSHTRPSW